MLDFKTLLEMNFGENGVSAAKMLLPALNKTLSVLLQQAIENNSTPMNTKILEAPGWYLLMCNKLYVYQPEKQSLARCSQPCFY